MSIWKPRSQRTICSDEKWGENEKLLAGVREVGAGRVCEHASICIWASSFPVFLPGLERIPPQSVSIQENPAADWLVHEDAVVRDWGAALCFGQPLLSFGSLGNIDGGSSVPPQHPGLTGWTLRRGRGCKLTFSKFSVLYTQAGLLRPPFNSSERRLCPAL